MSHAKERTLIGLVLCILLGSTVIDIFEDIKRGDGVAQIFFDLVIVASIGALLGYVYVLEPFRLRQENRRLAERTQEQENDLAKLSSIARKQLDGLGAYIDAQFDAWELTDAEKDVALLLLKGFSMKEISVLRKVSERTIRQQATTIYGKAGLSGRAGLSAYFLEDLLLPSHQS